MTHATVNGTGHWLRGSRVFLQSLLDRPSAWRGHWVFHQFFILWHQERFTRLDMQCFSWLFCSYFVIKLSYGVNCYIRFKIPYIWTQINMVCLLRISPADNTQNIIIQAGERVYIWAYLTCFSVLMNRFILKEVVAKYCLVGWFISFWLYIHTTTNWLYVFYCIGVVK